MNNLLFYATGKKKTSIARVFIKNGNGKFNINKLNLYDYCKNNENIKFLIFYPFNIVNLDIKIFDIYITVKGGGVFSQIFAIRHGISKAILNYNLEYRNILRSNGLLTRDSRIVERKKVGFKKSRKKPQFSKR